MLAVADAKAPLYKALPHNDSIRLFRLDPAASIDTPLSGSLTTVRRSQCQPYRALSYMWGPPHPSTDQELCVNDHLLSLRANLASCLRAYREHLQASRIRQNLPFWIDLICIQQDCIEEKNHQVQQMGAIYKEAKSVLVWLGQSTKVDVLDCFRGNGIPASLKGKPPKNSAELRLLFRSLLNQHWTRTWILQELCLAQQIAVFTERNVFHSKVLGQIETDIGWIDEAYSEGWHASAMYSNPHATATEFFDRFAKIWSVRDSRRDPRWKPLSLCSTVYQLGRDSDCSHHRDKVFAFLQMSSSNADIEVDYNKDETLIFWNVLTSMKMEDLEFTEVDCLREVLQLTWKRLLTSTVESTDPQLEGIVLPCYLDCGTLTLKVSRARTPWRRCRKSTEVYNSWFQTDSTSVETMFRLVLKHLHERTYEIKELHFCPNGSDSLYGNLLSTPAPLQVLDESWVTRWETVAVQPHLFMTLCFVASLDPVADTNVLLETFPDALRTYDRYFKQRSATKKFGMRLA